MKKLSIVVTPALFFIVPVMSQNVGIGTAAPIYKLTVQTPDNQFGIAHTNGTVTFGSYIGGGKSWLGNLSNHPLGITINGLEQITLLTNGYLGIGTLTPDNVLHVCKANSGGTGYSGAPLIVENVTASYVNILAPDVNETGILFGKASNNVSGGLIYNSPGVLNGFQFRTNGNLTRMVLTDIGNLGVGSISPGNYKLKVAHSTNGFFIENASGTSISGHGWEFHVNNTDGYLDLFYDADFRGSFNRVTGTYTGASDRRLKTNITSMESMLKKIMQLKPSTYRFKKDKERQVYNGFIAQEVKKIFPNLVRHNVDPIRGLDSYSMDYSGFGIIAIKGVQELNNIIEDQKIKISQLELRLNKLEAIVTSNNAR